MDSGGQKSIFSQKSRVKLIHQNWPKNVLKNQKFNFSTKIGAKLIPLRSQIDFWSKKKNSNFRPKMDPGGQKSIFGQKIESSIFGPKFAQNGS